MKPMFALLAALASGSAFGACENARLPETPVIPDGVEATFEEMAAAHDAVEAFVESGEAYLACAKPISLMHNYIVERLESVADEFNAERAEFVQRREAIASN